MQKAEIRLANTARVFEHLLKYRVEFPGRRTDDLQHFRSRGLLFQRLLGIIEQPRILDGDDGLVGKGAQQLDVMIGEHTRLAPRAGDVTDQRALAH